MTLCIVLQKKPFFPSSFVAIFWRFPPSNAPIMLHNIHYWRFLLSQIDEQNTLHIAKYSGPNLVYWCLHLWSLWTTFTCCSLLSWLPIWLRSELVNPCFINCHIFTQKKIVFVGWNSCKPRSESSTPRCFLIDCEQIRRPLWTQLSLWQMFIKNGAYTAFWYIQLFGYLTQLQFTIDQNGFVKFYVFRDYCRIWATWAFSIISISTTAFKVNIPPLNRCFWRGRVRITLTKPLLCLNSIFPSESNALSTH